MENVQNDTALGDNTMTLNCFTIPPMINSPGILNATLRYNNNSSSGNGYLSYSLPLLELQIGLIIIVSQTFHFLLKRFGINLFASSILTGIVLGPTSLGKSGFMADTLFSSESQEVLNVLVVIGSFMFIFLTAVKTDIGIVLKTGRKAMSIGVLSGLAPFLIGMFYLSIIKKKISKSPEQSEATFDIVIQLQSFTAFPVVVYVLDHLRITNSELGRLGLSSALVADVIGIVISVAFSLINDIHGHGTRNFIGVLAFLLVASFLFRRVMLWMIKKTPQGKAIDSSYICSIMSLAFISGFYFSMFDQIVFLGPVILGFTVPAGPPLGAALTEKFETITLYVFLPIQVATSVMRVDLLLIMHEFTELKYYVIAVVIISVAKFAGTLIPSTLFFKMTFVDSMVLGFIICSKGITEMTHYSVLIEKKVISDEVYVVLILFIFFNSTFSPILIKFFYDPSRKYAGYQTRNIIGSKPESELRILTCIHTPDNIDPAIKMLDAIYPTKENPLTVYVLYLMELIGRATPVFLAHEKYKPISVSTPCSQNAIQAILSFGQYELKHLNSISVHNFTAISPAMMMSEDVCTLAVEKDASLILIPLHRRWSNAGIIESENPVMRTVTCSILDKAPCSVGIFFNRTKLRFRDEPITRPKGILLSLCVIFLGGNDDREALTLAKRMAKNAFASLTIVHIVAADIEEKNRVESESDEKVLDAKLLDEVKQYSFSNDLLVIYRRHSVIDGAETALLVHSMANEFDLFIVGRRHGIESRQTVGLSYWSELPELGPIGDFLASEDFNTRASVLVVQQHRHKNQHLS